MIGFKVEYNDDGYAYAIKKDDLYNVAVLTDENGVMKIDLSGGFDIDDIRELRNCIDELLAGMRELWK